MAFFVFNPTHRLVSFFIKKMREEDVPHLAPHHSRKVLRPALFNIQVGPQRREDLCLLTNMTEEELSQNREVLMMLARGSLLLDKEAPPEDLLLPEEPKADEPKAEEPKPEEPKEEEPKEPKGKNSKKEEVKEELVDEESLQEEKVLSEILGPSESETLPPEVKEVVVEALPEGPISVPVVPEAVKETVFELTGDERWKNTPFADLEPSPKFKETLKKKAGRPKSKK